MRQLALAVAVMCAVLSAGCRQPDGRVPELDSEGQNRVSDIGRDLLAIAGGDAAEIEGLAKDLGVFVGDGDLTANNEVRQFALHLGEAMRMARLSSESAAAIARTAWMLVAITDLSERQRQALEGDLRKELTASGIPDAQIGSLVAEMPAVQRAVSTRPRRWYEVL